MSETRVISTLAGLLLAFPVLVTAANADDIDYEEEPVGALPSGTELTIGAPPYYIAMTGLSAIEDGLTCAPACPDNGTIYHRNFDSGFANIIAIRADPDSGCVDCVPIDLLKIDVAESDPTAGPVTVLILALGAGAPPPFGFVTDGIADGPGGLPDFETVTLPATFVGLDIVTVSSATPGLGIAIDNIEVDGAIPLPALSPIALATLTLFLCITASCVDRKRSHA